jgi:hypothetical protein
MVNYTLPSGHTNQSRQHWAAHSRFKFKLLQSTPYGIGVFLNLREIVAAQQRSQILGRNAPILFEKQDSS